MNARKFHCYQQASKHPALKEEPQKEWAGHVMQFNSGICSVRKPRGWGQFQAGMKAIHQALDCDKLVCHL